METPKKVQSEEQLNEWLRISERGFSRLEGDFSGEETLGDESDPLGRLLKIISGMPEIRAEKLEIARGHLRQPDEVIDAKMEAALDKVLEELIIDD